MPTRTLSPAALRPPRAERRAARVLVVDDAEGRGRTPDWLARGARGAGWELHGHPGTGPGAAAAAAAMEVRVLLLRPPAPEPQAEPTDRGLRVVAALRGLPDDAPVVADAAEWAARSGAALTLVHAVPRSFGERSVGLDGAVAHGRRLLDAGARQTRAAHPTVTVDCALLRMRPYELVGEGLDADLLVVGGLRAGRPVHGPGLVAQSALHHAHCPVLLVPR
jgi:nucleotide-binding universal stress UspA family protein